MFLFHFNNIFNKFNFTILGQQWMPVQTTTIVSLGETREWHNPNAG